MMALNSLFLTAFGAATFLPIQSEIVLLALAHTTEHSLWLLWAIATAGNTLGALVNYGLGWHLPRFVHRRWFPITPEAVNKATPTYQKWGKWSLLLAWVPIIGDPLTLIAGIFRTSLWWFVPLVALGKGARYGALLML